MLWVLHPFWLQGVRCRRYRGLQLLISPSTERNKVSILQADGFLQRSLCFISWPSHWHSMNTEPLFAFWSGQAHSQHLPVGYTIFPVSPPKCLRQLYWFMELQNSFAFHVPTLQALPTSCYVWRKNTTRITSSIIFICSPSLARKKENQSQPFQHWELPKSQSKGTQIFLGRVPGRKENITGRCVSGVAVGNHVVGQCQCYKESWNI